MILGCTVQWLTQMYNTTLEQDRDILHRQDLAREMKVQGRPAVHPPLWVACCMGYMWVNQSVLFADGG